MRPERGAGRRNARGSSTDSSMQVERQKGWWHGKGTAGKKGQGANRLIFASKGNLAGHNNMSSAVGSLEQEGAKCSTAMVRLREGHMM